MDAAFRDSFFVQPPALLGVQLVPFCLGHAARLHAIGSPLFDRVDWTRQDLAMAIVVCSRPGVPPFTPGFEDGLSDAAAAAAKKVGAALIDDETWKATLDGFLQYIHDFMRFPDVWGDDTKKSDAGAPWVWTIVWRLMERVSEERAWTMPLILAACYVSVGLELDGRMKLVSDLDRALLDEATAEVAL